MNQEYLFAEGLRILKAHRTNYSSKGPNHLAVLWWEWPELHWPELRLGASMNFMESPVPEKIPNSKMDTELLAAAIVFVDELISLKVLIPYPDELILNTFPLFLVPKPYQAGQYRTIADGKSGGQNDVCVADPCHMTSPDHILPYLYRNGFSATLDLSKYFHMFLTKPEEHKYMGITHPGTGAMHVFRTFAMGTRNSPGASGRFGAALIRIIMDTSDLFKGVVVDNSIQQYFSRKVHHPKYGEGRILIGVVDGLPVVLLWLHVDDLLIHAPTRAKLTDALDHILNTIIRLGLICNYSKTNLPSQRVKFCGFVYDTSSTPTLCIPQNKVSRAIAITDYLLTGLTMSMSRLVVSMVTGFLQSLVPATPGNIGATFLRPIYDDLHNMPLNSGHQTKDDYFCAMNLSERSRLCLFWWIEALKLGLSKQS